MKYDNKKFMSFIRNEVSKKGLSDNELVKFALIDLDDASNRVCREIKFGTKEGVNKYLDELNTSLNWYVKVCHGVKLINTDDLFFYRSEINKFYRNELKLINA